MFKRNNEANKQKQSISLKMNIVIQELHIIFRNPAFFHHNPV